jgi:hypothetical protein
MIFPVYMLINIIVQLLILYYYYTIFCVRANNHKPIDYYILIFLIHHTNVPNNELIKFHLFTKHQVFL